MSARCYGYLSILLSQAIFASYGFSNDPINVTLTSQVLTSKDPQTFEKLIRKEAWTPSETAIIVCDVWDYHHCFNAVKRLEEFAPRLNDVLKTARQSGVVIIHSPSDCMPAYAEHPARKRAIDTPEVDRLPEDITSWCSRIPQEEEAVYPIDQSDGGEDDDPEEHAAWAAKLKSLGRNPGMPWKKQSDMISIESDTDYISDRGDEVWRILESRGIKNVILAGVHINMCVLGRPFGLRQLAKNGKNVVLMRDMTDAMYNPQRWPFVSHHEGTRRVIEHIERYVCPTMTSDQILGGKPFEFRNANTNQETSSVPVSTGSDYWKLVSIPTKTPLTVVTASDSTWLRAVVRVPQSWIDQEISLELSQLPQVSAAWCNGSKLTLKGDGQTITASIPSKILISDDANLIVLQLKSGSIPIAPAIVAGTDRLELSGRWQYQSGGDDTLSNMPLPAKFGTATDIVFAPEEPLWMPTAVTRIGEFTPGIEGPACDAQGNIFAVNYLKQGTIGKVSPAGIGTVFVTLPAGSIGNGIRFTPEGNFYVADYTGHNVLFVNAKSQQVSVFAHEPKMSQPNDLAMAPDGTLYASDPNWGEGTGQVWRIDRDGHVTLVADKLGTANGIEVSPNGKTLYVNESKQRNIWAFSIDAHGELKEKRLLRQFEDHGFDGMRCDVDGNLYVTRYGKGTVVKLSPSGEILKEISVLGARPSNICFGGPDGRTAYVTEVEYTRLVSFRVDRPGRSFHPNSAKKQ